MAKRIYIGNISDISDKKIVEVEGKQILIIKYGDTFYAIDNICTHEFLPMNDGWLEDEFYVCPWHLAKFNIKTGKVSEETPWATDIPTYKVVVEKDKIFLELD